MRDRIPLWESFLVAFCSTILLASVQIQAQIQNRRPEPVGGSAWPAPERQGQKQQKSPQESVPKFYSGSRLVVVDVVATDQNGNLIGGLGKDDFTILEDGKPQPLRSFEPHVPARQGTVPDLHLGPNEFTNFPKQATNSAVNVVLFDILNTPVEDQLYARQQMVDFVKTLPRVERVALFTLNDELKMVAGFTTSTDELIAAALEVKPAFSALLLSEPGAREAPLGMHDIAKLLPSASITAGSRGENLHTTFLRNDPGALNSGAPMNSGAPSMGELMQQFLTDERLIRIDQRAEKTMEAFGQLARAMAGYTGRKNLLWLSEAFPGAVQPRQGSVHLSTRNYLETFQRYSGLLQASQVSLYPIDVRGLKTGAPAVSGPALGSTQARGAADDTHTMLGGSQLVMREVAEETGGEFFINTNDLKRAMRRSIEHGSTYYTLAYSPLNRKMDSSFRHIEVKVSRANTRLDYRRGYYALADDPGPEDTSRRMMIAQMQPGVPESTMLLLRVRVVPSEVAGKLSIDYGVYAPDLGFSGDDVKHAKLEFTAVAWDQKNKAAGNVSETMQLDLKPDTYQKILARGVPAHQELMLKPGAYNLRLGVMDYGTGKIGTLELPVVIPKQTASK